MTISSTTRIAGPFTGNGTASTFPFTFKVFAAADLDVVRLNSSTGVESTLVLSSDYSVTLNGDQNSNPGGSITLLAGALASGFTLTITSDIANLQPTDLTNQGGFYPEVITDALDRATIQIQQMSEDVGRSLKGPISDGSLNMELPTAAQRANSFLAFDANGVPTAVVSGSSGAPTTITRQVFSGTGSQTVFTLASDPGALGNSAQVYIGGVYQQRSTYTIAGTTLTFSAAPVAGTDNIEFVNFLTSNIGSTSADLVTYTPSGTGAVARSAASKMGDVVSVKDFGAVGDGVADDTSAIQAAMTAIGNGKVLFFPRGTYQISSPISVASSYVTIAGEGWQSVVKQTSVATSKNAFTCDQDGLTVCDIKIESPTQTGNENAGISIAKSGGAAAYDIRVENVWFEKFSYAVVAVNPHRAIIHKNYIYSTGDNSTDTGGAIQMSGAVQTTISSNIITGDPSAKFQHGIYISGDISETAVTKNAISDGFYSWGIHVYGSTFTSGRFGMIVSENQINDVPNGIIFSNSGVANSNVRAVSVVDNKIYVSERALFFNGATIENVIIGSNYCRSSGSAAANPILEVTQSAGQSATDIRITNNIFKNFRNGGIDLNNAVSMSGIRIEGNSFDPQTTGDACLILDSTNTGQYANFTVIGNRNVGANTIVVSPTWYSSYKNASWMTMTGNSFDPEYWSKATPVTTTPYAVLASDQTLLVTTGASTITIDLPTVSGGSALNGRIIYVTKVDSGAGTVVIDAFGAQTINGSATYTLSNQYDWVRLVLVNGTEWLAMS